MDREQIFFVGYDTSNASFVKTIERVKKKNQLNPFNLCFNQKKTSESRIIS